MKYWNTKKIYSLRRKNVKPKDAFAFEVENAKK
jgi:hypothetical protein